MNEKLKEIFSYQAWRQAIELGDGLRTPGFIDNSIWNVLGLPGKVTGQSFLDIGANDGMFSFEAEKRGASKVVASDLYKESTETMKDGWSLRGVSLLKDYLHSNITFHKEGIYKLHELNEKFDTVLVNNVIVWLEDIDLAIKELYEATGKTLYIADGFLVDNTEPKKTKLQNRAMRYMYNVKYITNLLEKQGFKVEAVWRYNNQKLFVKNFISFPQIQTTAETKIYNTPEMDSSFSFAEPRKEQCNSKYGDFFHMAELGWVHKTDVVVNYLKPSALYTLANAVGLNTLYYRFLQYKHIKNNGNTAYVIKATK